MTTISVRNLRRYGEAGWEFTVHCPDEDEPREFRTNGHGTGLFFWTRPANTISRDAREWVQTQGTMQFHLPESRTGAYSAIRRYFSVARS